MEPEPEHGSAVYGREGLSHDSQVLILGGGLSGCLIAAGLADRGVRVSIIEQREQLMSAASRWNDGKIHLGYTFTGTPSMATAALMQEGVCRVPRWAGADLGSALPEAWIGNGVVYLVDRASLVDVDTLWERAKLVARRTTRESCADAGMRRYLDGQPRLERLPVGAGGEELTRPARHRRRVADARAPSSRRVAWPMLWPRRSGHATWMSCEGQVVGVE